MVPDKQLSPGAIEIPRQIEFEKERVYGVEKPKKREEKLLAKIWVAYKLCREVLFDSNTYDELLVKVAQNKERKT